MDIREALTDAIRFWEIRRIVYNAILAFVVVAAFAIYWPDSKAAISVERAQGIFILAVLANAAYCAAYLVDLPAQLSGYSAVWRRHRWILFAIGVLFAGIITRFVAIGMVAHAA
jgi:hypothetical protein